MKLKVLVIDDTPVIREFLNEVFTDAGFLVDIAEDGRIGYEKALKEDYAFVISDVHMPVMNGLETIRRIKDAKPEMPVIMTDSFPDKAAELAKEAGAICCLAKPFALEELRETVNNILEERKANRSDRDKTKKQPAG